MARVTTSLRSKSKIPGPSGAASQIALHRGHAQSVWGLVSASLGGAHVCIPFIRPTLPLDARESHACDL
jgi:hypothetical protein